MKLPVFVFFPNIDLFMKCIGVMAVSSLNEKNKFIPTPFPEPYTPMLRGLTAKEFLRASPQKKLCREAD